MRALALLGWTVALAASSPACGGDRGAPKLVTIEGDVLAFLGEVNGERVAGAKVSILERPETSVLTDGDAHFRFDGVAVGSEVTLLVEHPSFQTTRTATIVVGANGVRPFTIQAVPVALFQGKAAFANAWAWIDAACDRASAFRAAARALYACRARSCELTLGGDDVCATEAAAFAALESSYGACMSARSPG